MNLKEFFIDEKITIPFKLFGKTHLFLILIIIISFIIIYHNRFKLTNLNIKTKKIITKLIALFLLLNMIILYISALYYHNFNFNTMLPFHLCYISNYFYIYTILFNKEKLFKYNYLLCFLGPIAAIIFFDVPSVLESFNFYSYVICHHIFLIGGILTFYLYPKHIYKKDLLKLFFILNIYFIFMIIFNYLFKTNYCFSNSIPKFILDLLPFLKNIHPIIILEITGIILICGLALFWNKQANNLLKRRNML